MNTPTVVESPVVNSTTGCQQLIININVKGTSCPKPFIPGISESCEEYCSLVSHMAANTSFHTNDTSILPYMPRRGCKLIQFLLIRYFWRVNTPGEFPFMSMRMSTLPPILQLSGSMTNSWFWILGILGKHSPVPIQICGSQVVP